MEEELDEITEKDISSEQASKITGYSKDYIGQLCRTNRLKGRLIGRSWIINIDDLLSYKEEQKKKAQEIKNIYSEKPEKIKITQLLQPLAAASLILALIMSFFLFSDEVKAAYNKAENILKTVSRTTNNLVNNLENGATSLSLALPEISFPQISFPQISFPEIKIPKPDFSFVQHSMLNIAASTGNTIISFFSFFNSGMETIGNLAKDIANAWIMAPQNVKELTQEFLGQETLIVAIQTPTPTPSAEPKNQTSDVAKQTLDVSPSTSNVVEKTIERIISSLTSEELDAKLNQLNSQILAQISGLKNELASQISANQNSIALTNRINNLGSVTISNPTFSGTVSGLTDADIPDTITASNYLSLSGGTITGALTVTSSTTFNGITYGWPSSAGTANQVLTTNGAGVLSWSTVSSGGNTTWEINANANLAPTTTLAVYLPSKLYASSTALFDGAITVTSTTATSTFPYLAVSTNSNLGTVIGGTWQGTAIAAGYGGTGLTTYTPNQLLYASGTGTIGQIATSSLGLLTTDVTEGTNQYYTDARARAAVSSTATGLTYTSGTGVFSLTSGYNIPLTASTTDWNSFWQTPSTRITAGDYIDWSGNTLNVVGTLPVSIGGTGLTSYTFGDVLYASGTGTLAGTTTPNLKTTLKLNLVENTALSTWLGTSNITTLGTIGTGVWNAGALTSSGAITGTNLVINSTTATSTFSTGGLTVGTSKFVVQQTSGNVGIGSTTPAQLLSVAGHCVTGDSELITEDGKTLRVDEVKGGEKILSLNEKTGELAPAKIQKLWDMGVKPIYKIETEDGKTIRTTAEHPYLVRFGFRSVEENHAKHNQSDNSSNDIDNNVIHDNLFTMLHGPNINQGDHDTYDNISNNDIVHNSFVSTNFNPPDKQPIVNIKPVINTGKLTFPENPGMKNPITVDANNILDKSIKKFESLSNWILFRNAINFNDNDNGDFVNPDVDKASWIKVAYLSEGDEIAVADDDLEGINFVKIKKITILPPEQVYDLSIESTHNFVANGIIAHNTYITGGLGAGLAETTSGNITGTGRLSITSTTATSTFSTGGLTVGTSQFVVQQTSGNVGIGTTIPGYRLDVFDGTQEMSFSSAALALANAGAVSQTLSFNNSAGNAAMAMDGSGNLVFYTSQGGLYFDNRGASDIHFRTTGSNTERVTILTNGNVGIGTTNPTLGRLQVNQASDGVTKGITVLNAAANQATYFWLDGAISRIDASSNGGGILAINGTGTGNVGIGTTNPGAQLDLSTDSARKLTTNTWTTGSDIRIKTDVQSIDNALEIIRQIRPVQFHYNSDFLASHPEAKDIAYYNFIAQEYQQVFPDSVTEIDGLLYLNSSNMIPYAIAAIKELDERISSQYNDILTWLEDKVMTVKKLFVREEICIGNTCINEEQLKQLLEKNQMVPSEPPQPLPSELPSPSPSPESSSQPSPSPSPEIIPTPAPEITPTPELTPELEITSDIEESVPEETPHE